MFKMKSIIRSLLVLLLVMSFTACVRDNISDFPIPYDNSKVFLSVSINVAGEDMRGTRADDVKFEPNPWGGESGNGKHEAEEYERTVNNMSMLFFHSDKNDLTDDEAKIDKVIYFPSVTSDGKRTIAVEVDPKYLKDTSLRFLVVANVGDLSAYQGRKLSDVRDQLITDVFKRDNNASFDNNGDLKGFSTFVMSSHGHSSMKFSGTGTEDDPYLIDHEIERLAARIDIMPHVQRYNLDKNNLYCNYCYNVTQGTEVIGGFVLEYVRPYNILSSQEYVFKRTATDASLANLQYLGLETADDNKKNTNYVVDPTSQNKSKADFKYPKDTEENWAKATYEDFYKTHNAGKTHTNSTGSKAVEVYDPETAYYILDYVKENTSFDNNEQYATGLVFKGKYYEKSDWDEATSQPRKGAVGKGKDKAYTYVIRHSDPTGKGEISEPMHYGIVRNNIYRVRIDGITGKGPDGMKITLNVRKWATYTHKETTM